MKRLLAAFALSFGMIFIGFSGEVSGENNDARGPGFSACDGESCGTEADLLTGGEAPWHKAKILPPSSAICLVLCFLHCTGPKVGCLTKSA